MRKRGRSCYVSGCDHPECAAANRAYSKERAKVTWQPDRVDAEYARAHVTMLRNKGMGLREIARASGVHRSTLANLFRSNKSGKPAAYLTRATHEKIMAVTLRRPNGSRVLGIGTARRAQALVAMGWTQTYLAERIGWTGGNFSTLLNGRPVRKDTAIKVARLYEELKYRRGPSDRARTRAAKYGWAFPDEWEGLAIDDPKTNPRRIA